jgi:hypothetical protein
MNVRCVGIEGSEQAVGEGRPDKRAPQAMAAAAGPRPRARVWVGGPCCRAGAEGEGRAAGPGREVGRGRKGAWAARRGRGAWASNAGRALGREQAEKGKGG